MRINNTSELQAIYSYFGIKNKIIISNSLELSQIKNEYTNMRDCAHEVFGDNRLDQKIDPCKDFVDSGQLDNYDDCLSEILGSFNQIYHS